MTLLSIVSWRGSALCCLPVWLATQQPVLDPVTTHDAIKVGFQGLGHHHDEAAAFIGSLQHTVAFSGCLSLMT